MRRHVLQWMFVGVLAVAAGACQSLPADRPFAPGEVTVEVLDRDADAGKARIAIENHTGVRMSYVWYFTRFSPTPAAGVRMNPWDLAVEGLVMHERPLGPGRRQILEFACNDSDGCSHSGNHVGVLVCREQRDSCMDFELVWSTNVVGSAHAAVSR